MDIMKEDMQKIGVTEEDTKDRVGWIICCGDPYREQSEEKHYMKSLDKQHSSHVNGKINLEFFGI